jgi:hypothetical protein
MNRVGEKPLPGRRCATLRSAVHTPATKIIFWSQKTSRTISVDDVFCDQNMIKPGATH